MRHTADPLQLSHWLGLEDVCLADAEDAVDVQEEERPLGHTKCCQEWRDRRGRRWPLALQRSRGRRWPLLVNGDHAGSLCSMDFRFGLIWTLRLNVRTRECKKQVGTAHHGPYHAQQRAERRTTKKSVTGAPHNT